MTSCDAPHLCLPRAPSCPGLRSPPACQLRAPQSTRQSPRPCTRPQILITTMASICLDRLGLRLGLRRWRLCRRRRRRRRRRLRAAAGAEPLAGSPHARRRWCRLRRRRKLPPPPAYRAGVFVLQPRRDAHQMEVVRALREGGSGERRVRAGAAGRACGRGSAPCPTPPESRHPGLRRLVRSRRAACGRCRRHRPRSSRSSWRPRASS